MKHEDEALKEELEKSIQKLEDAEVPTPEFKYFKDMVDKQQAAVRKAQKRQLALFSIVAAALISAIILLMGKFEVLFIVLQGAAFIGSIAGLSVFYARRPKEGFR